MTYDKFLVFLSERFGIETDMLQEVDSFSELGVDSLSLFNLITDLEEEFKIRIEIEDLTEIDTVKKMYDYVCDKAKEQ